MRSDTGIMMLKQVVRVLTLFLAVSLTACSSPPDVAPVGKATSTMYAVIAQADQVLIGEKSLSAEQKQRFDAAWQRRVVAAKAMADYSAQLVAVMNAGNDGRAEAGKVTEAVKGLVNSVAGSTVWGATANQVADVFKVLYDQVAKQRASDTIAEALAENNRHVQAFAAIILEDTRPLRILVKAGNDAERQQLFDRQDPGLLIEAGVRDRAKAALKAFSDATNNPNATAADLTASRDNLGALVALQKSVAEEPSYVQWKQELQDMEALHKSRLQLVTQLGVVTTAWAAAHADLLRVAQEHRAVDFGQLLAVSDELLAIYKKAGEK